MEDPRSEDLDDNEVTIDGGSGIVADIDSVPAGRPTLITHDEGRPLSRLPAREPLLSDRSDDSTLVNGEVMSGGTARTGVALDNRLPRPRSIPLTLTPKPSKRAARLNEIRGRIEQIGADPGHPDEPDPQPLPAPPAEDLIAEIPEPPVPLKLEDMVLPTPPDDLGLDTARAIERDRIRTSNRSAGRHTNSSLTAELAHAKRSRRVRLLIGWSALLIVLIIALAVGYSRGVGA